MKNKLNFYEILVVFLMGIIILFSGILAGIKCRFPFEYESEIKYYANKYNLEQSLIYAVINAESGFDSLAKSIVGARGLMQIMPETGKWVAGKLGVINYSHELLFVPWINIEFGCYYLRYLFDKYENEHKVLFSYNAGEGVMNNTYSPDEALVVETIQIIETKEYIQKVEYNKKFYNYIINKLKMV